MAELRLDAVTKRFGTVAAVDQLSLTVADGEFVVLLGPTGAGKTTTLRLAAGLERPDTGTVHIGGADVTRMPPADRDVTFVFQQYSLYPHLNVRENLAFPLRAPTRRLSADAIARRVERVAELLRIADKLDNPATKLSGGQMQRVAIGRALVRSPSVYLMDEPLSSLDAKLREELRIELKRIQQQLGATILYVTHDQTEALTMADRIGVVDHGRLVQIGAPRDIYEDPLNSYVAMRLGQPAINLLPMAGLPQALFAATGEPPQRTVTIGVRTEHIAITPLPSPVKGGAATAIEGGTVGRITWIEHLGDQNHLHIELAGRSLVTLADPDMPLVPGDHVSLSLMAPLCFDADGNRLRG